MHDIMNKPELKSVRKDLRNMSTSAEATLWKLIKGQQIDGLKFRRQHSVGPYILDFYCPQFRLGIELDGEVHSTTEAMDYADNNRLTHSPTTSPLRGLLLPEGGEC